MIFTIYVLTILLAIPLLMVSLECVLSIFLKNKPVDGFPNQAKVDISTIILIPAHNECKGIAVTLTKLQSELSDRDHVVVVADNCSDETAEIARLNGADVTERDDLKFVGKGYALNYGVEYIKERYDYDIIVVLDADCYFEKDSLSMLSRTAYFKHAPVQAINISLPPVSDNIRIGHKIAQFAWLIKNKVRPLGLSFLKLPVMLTGTGMAFPKEVVLELEFDSGHIAEDMLLGVNLAKKSIFTQLSSNAKVYSHFPDDVEAENKQKTRWVHGHMSIIQSSVPSLLCAAMQRRSLKLMMLAIDLLVPPLVVLALISIGLLIFTILLSFFNEHFNPLLMFMCISMIIFICSILFSWWIYARDILKLRELCAIPMHIYSKYSIYIS